MRQYFEAFRLLCINEGWKWTKEQFLSKILKEEIDSVALKSNEKSLLIDMQLKYKYQFCFYFLIKNGIISTMCPADESDFAIDSIKNIGTCLKTLEKEKVFIKYEFALIESLVQICSFDPVESFKLIEMWYEKFKKRSSQQRITSKTPKAFQRKILTAQNMHKHKLENCVKILSF